MTICKQCFVSGKVQGVFYRDSTRRQAEKLQLTGYAKNLTDGRVEVLVCGQEASVEELCDWLWTGSDYSTVSDVQCQEIEAGDFTQTNKFVTM
jgi:acylphosphatase